VAHAEHARGTGACHKVSGGSGAWGFPRLRRFSTNQAHLCAIRALYGASLIASARARLCVRSP